MANFKVLVDHALERTVVISRLQNFSEQVKKDSFVEISEIEETWDELGNLSFAFRAMGFKISGTVITCAERVAVSGNIPFAALPFRGAIENQVADKIREAIQIEK